MNQLKTPHSAGVAPEPTRETPAESEALFRSVFEHGPLALALVGLDGRILTCNRRCCEFLGLTPEQVAGRSFAEVTHPDDVALSRDYVCRAVRCRGQLPELEKRYLRADGQVRLARTLVSVLRNADARPLYFVVQIQDVTEQRRLEASLRQAQKMESIGQLAGGLAHDFNNYLTVIAGNVELAQRQLPAGGPLREIVDEIQRITTNAARLTRQLLSLSRRQVYEPAELDVNGLLGTLRPMLELMLNGDIELNLELEEGLGAVFADPALLEQVLMNLAANARDAMPHGGRLSFETAEVEVAEGQFGPRAEALPGRYIRIGVSDTGCGMSPEVRERLFEPFFTTKPKGEGTGLGLSMVYGTVRQSHGFIEVLSEPGKGARIDIYLPRREPRSEFPAGAGPTPAEIPAAGNGETVLLVDDDANVRKVTTLLLEMLGYRVLVCASASEALEKSRQHAGLLHLVMADVLMPGMNGPELVAELRKQRPGLPALFSSGHADVDLTRLGSFEPGAHFLGKPYKVDALAAKLREVLA